MNYPSCGAGTPLTAPTRFGDPGPSCGTSPAFNHPPRTNEGGHRRLNSPTPPTMPDLSTDCAAPAPPCEGAPTAETASSGSKCPGARLRTWPSPTAHACDLPALTERTPDCGAADRECVLVLIGLRHAANDPDDRSSPIRFVLRLSDPCFWFRPSVQPLFILSGAHGPEPSFAATARS